MEARKPSLVHYPHSDGKPLADNTVQFRWIVLLKENLDAWLPDFVAGDLLWYPVEGDNHARVAPDVLVALGRPKGERGSYRQWEEGDTAPQFVIEVLSPGNTIRETERASAAEGARARESKYEMNEKRKFYERYGVMEYIIIDPDLDAPERALFEVWVREHGRLQLADFDGEYHSAQLGIRFSRENEALLVRYPDGTLPDARAAPRRARRGGCRARRGDRGARRGDCGAGPIARETSRAGAQSRRGMTVYVDRAAQSVRCRRQGLGVYLAVAQRHRLRQYGLPLGSDVVFAQV